MSHVHSGPLTPEQVNDIACALLPLREPHTAGDGMLWVGLVSAGQGRVRVHGAHSPVADDTAFREQAMPDGRIALVLRHLGTDTVLGAASPETARACLGALRAALER